MVLQIKMKQGRQSLRIHLIDLLGRVIISKIIALGQELSKNASN